MTNYRRFYISKATWFFTVNLVERKNNHLLVEKINELRDAFRYVLKQKPFRINAIVVMPDHLHCIWTLPQDDSDYSIRWNMLKGRFPRSIGHGESISKSRQKRRERGIWAHLITDQDDFNRHFDYIHWNPVKHSKVASVAEWPDSSFHRYVRQGIYSESWGNDGRFVIEDAE